VTSCTALIVAAGRGSRFGGPHPKQYAALGGKSVLRHTLEVFASCAGIADTRVVIASGDESLYQTSASGLVLSPPVIGGASRQQSVLHGLEAMAADPPDFVAIHDAARPFVTHEQIAACLAAAARPGIDGAVLGVPLADTLKRVDGGNAITDTVPRAQLWRAQTPQVFRFARLLSAHRGAAQLGAADATALTDDAAVAELANLKVVMVAGSEDNRKITTADDLARSTAVETRTAFGFDVHGFAEGSSIMLGGIAIPHQCGLAGHSDADVAACPDRRPARHDRRRRHRPALPALRSAMARRLVGSLPAPRRRAGDGQRRTHPSS
jgi:2-C-methyl-D-erythritol 4-phosphate cytidylyltransferase/2-C-methyl-D-erythritol 2,4-cyclodiphosphate synthase